MPGSTRDVCAEPQTCLQVGSAAARLLPLAGRISPKGLTGLGCRFPDIDEPSRQPAPDHLLQRLKLVHQVRAVPAALLDGADGVDDGRVVPPAQVAADLLQ